MIQYRELKKRPQLFKSITGLSEKGFEQLLPAFRKACAQALTERDKQRQQPRQRKAGGGRKGALPMIEDKLIFILCYFQLYPIQTLQGFLFGWLHFLTPILNQSLGYEKQLPTQQTKDIAQVLVCWWLALNCNSLLMDNRPVFELFSPKRNPKEVN